MTNRRWWLTTTAIGFAAMVGACASAPTPTPTCHTTEGQQRWLSREFWEEMDLGAVIGELNCGANVRQSRSDDAATPLHLAAAYSDDPEIVEELLGRGADIERRGKLGIAPLHWAANPAVIKVLVDNGADIHARDDFGMTSLHRAAIFEKPTAIQSLLENGANIEAKDYSGNTPLHRAAWLNPDPEAVIQALLDNGADIHSVNDDMWTPLDLAIAQSNDEAIRVLWENGG